MITYVSIYAFDYLGTDFLNENQFDLISGDFSVVSKKKICNCFVLIRKLWGPK
jgi:hypothetical protein